MFWDDPFDEMRRFLEDIDRSFYYRYPKNIRKTHREPVTDVWENDNFVFVTAELPGIKKDEIDINVEETSIEIKAKSKSSKKEEQEDERSYFEAYRNFYVKLDLPSRVNPDKVEATFSNGILEVKIQKLGGKKKKIEIKDKE